MEGDTLKRGAQGWLWKHRGHRKGQFSCSSPHTGRRPGLDARVTRAKQTQSWSSSPPKRGQTYGHTSLEGQALWETTRAQGDQQGSPQLGQGYPEQGP